MKQARLLVIDGTAKVVGSIGSLEDLRQTNASDVRAACDIAEIRLDLVLSENDGVEAAPWRHLEDVPLLFTLRRQDEGGARAIDAAARMALLEAVFEHAACIDLEVASMGEMAALVKTMATRGLPWIASYHDFDQVPDASILADAARRSRDAGASGFKVAAMLRYPADLARLADFQLADHGLPVATMGMGPLAAVSRLLCAQCGSVLNYGYLGKTATAPGQWDASSLQQAIARLLPLSCLR